MPLTNISNARIHSVEVKPAPDCTGSASMVRVYFNYTWHYSGWIQDNHLNVPQTIPLSTSNERYCRNCCGEFHLVVVTQSTNMEGYTFQDIWEMFKEGVGYFLQYLSKTYPSIRENLSCMFILLVLLLIVFGVIIIKVCCLCGCCRMTTCCCRPVYSPAPTEMQ